MSQTAVEAIQALKRAAEPHWATMALFGASTCAYDWIAADDRLEWLGDPKGLFDLEGEAPATMDALRALVRGGSRISFDKEHDIGADGRETFASRYALRTCTGDYIGVLDRGMVMRGGDGRVERVFGLMALMATTRAVDQEQTAHLDRGQMRDAIDAAIDWATTENAKAALLMASIDGLGAINDAYGLDVADELIAESTHRLALTLGTAGALGRVGGNKVAVLLLECDEAGIQEHGARLRDAVQASMIVTAAGAIAATVSIGAVTLPSGAPTSEVAMMRAEDALARAKSTGRSNLAIYDASPEREAARRKKAQIGTDIIAGLRADRFRIAYQPIVCARTGRIESYEALIRMLADDGTPVPAGEFIPVSEELGLVRDLDRRVLELVAGALKRAPALKLGVNVSGMSVGDPAWMKTFAERLAGDRSVTSRLTVEVTETAALLDIEEGIRFVRYLRAAGCRVAIDDFGVGYTSFRNLQTLDLSCVKIDGTFVKGIMRRPDNQAFVRTLVSLAKTFNLEVVAEWVGSKEEATLLRALGVDRLQGAFYGMPEMTPPWERRPIAVAGE